MNTIFVYFCTYIDDLNNQFWLFLDEHFGIKHEK